VHYYRIRNRWKWLIRHEQQRDRLRASLSHVYRAIRATDPATTGPLDRTKDKRHRCTLVEGRVSTRTETNSTDGRKRRVDDRRLALELRSQASRRSSSLAPSRLAMHPVCMVHSWGRVLRHKPVSNTSTYCDERAWLKVCLSVCPHTWHALCRLLFLTVKNQVSAIFSDISIVVYFVFCSDSVSGCFHPFLN